MHPEERLPDYVLGWLEPSEQREIEAHLEDCAQCRLEVWALREGLSALTESLPPERVNPQVWASIQATLAADAARGVPVASVAPLPGAILPLQPPSRRPFWVPLGLAASVALLTTSVLWGMGLNQQRQRLMADQRAVGGWLADPAVGLKSLREPGRPVQATALVRADGSALIVLPAGAPPGKTFQIWGIVRNEQGERTITSIGQTRGTLVQVRWQGYGALWLSLEPAGGSPQPTQTLGRTRLL